MKNVIKLTEYDLKKVISESVKKVLKEGRYDFYYPNSGLEYLKLKDYFVKKIKEIGDQRCTESELLGGPDYEVVDEAINKAILALNELSEIFTLNEIPPIEMTKMGLNAYGDKAREYKKPHDYGKLG